MFHQKTSSASQVVRRIQTDGQTEEYDKAMSFSQFCIHPKTEKKKKKPIIFTETDLGK